MSTLFVHHRPPHCGTASQDSLDALLVLAAFGQSPSVLFMAEGVWQLVGQQHSAAFAYPSLSAQLQSLALYEVDDVYVEAESLHYRHLSIEHLAIPVKLLARAELAAFMARHTHIIRL